MTAASFESAGLVLRTLPWMIFLNIVRADASRTERMATRFGVSVGNRNCKESRFRS